MPSQLLDPSLADSDHPALVAVARVQMTERMSPRHHHARGQLLGALDGLITVEAEGARRVVPAVSAIWLPPACPHAARSHGPFRGWSVYVAPSACSELPGEPTTLRVTGLLREAVKRAIGWTSGPWTPARERIAGVILDEIRTAPRETVAIPIPSDPRLRRIADALLREPSDARTMASWARWTGIAPRTLTRRFKDETGFDFSAWRQRVRIVRALERLAEGAAVTTVALEVGYETVSAFIAAFRSVVGATPAKYAERWRH